MLQSDEWERDGNLVMYRGHVYVPKDPELCHDIVHAHHDSMMTSLPRQWKMVQLVPLEMERPLGASRLGLSHWAGPSVTGSAGWSQKWYRGIIVDILAKESKFP